MSPYSTQTNCACMSVREVVVVLDSDEDDHANLATPTPTTTPAPTLPQASPAGREIDWALFDFEDDDYPDIPDQTWSPPPLAAPTAVSGRYADMPLGLSVVDPSWEQLDPNPNIRELFLIFNSLFFDDALSGIEVTWSRSMTLCAGVCSFDGQLCSVRLSEVFSLKISFLLTNFIQSSPQPLLKLRPRSDLVNTLLHEMIHGAMLCASYSPPTHSFLFQHSSS